MNAFLIEWFAAWVVQVCFFGGILLVLTALELLLPRGPRNLAGRLQGVVFWSLWLPASAFIVAAFHALWVRLDVDPVFLLDLRKAIAGTGYFAPVLAMLIAALVGDFFFYWFHRAQHAFFWRFHAVHHAVEDMNAVNSYHHVSEALFRVVLISIPANLLVVETGRLIPICSFLVAAQVVFIHSPTRVNFGPLRVLLADNVYHRIHHGRDAAYFDKNFAAATPIWDALFGTLRWPRKDEWPEVGLNEMPEPKSIREWLDLPLRMRRQAALPAAVPAEGAPV